MSVRGLGRDASALVESHCAPLPSQRLALSTTTHDFTRVLEAPIRKPPGLAEVVVCGVIHGGMNAGRRNALTIHYGVGHLISHLLSTHHNKADGIVITNSIRNHTWPRNTHSPNQPATKMSLGCTCVACRRHDRAHQPWLASRRLEVHLGLSIGRCVAPRVSNQYALTMNIHL